MSLSDDKYVSVATFRKTGEAVPTPTWIVPLEDGRVGFWTSSASGKAKRLRNNPRVTVQPSDMRGRITEGTQPVGGTASVVTSGPEFDEVQAKVKAKYGFTVHVTKLMNTLGHLGKGSFPYGDVVVLISLD